jgi:Zn-dependent protease/CBS domain-containing protein
MDPSDPSRSASAVSVRRSGKGPGAGIPIGELFGIQIRIDPSWFFIFLLVTWSLASSFSQWHPAWGLTLQIATALAASLLFFASVLAHELAHSLVARSRGLPVRRITLFLFGGVSNLEREPSAPGTEFLMAVVGPLTSILLGFLFLILGSPGAMRIAVTDPIGALSGLGPISTLLLWLGPVNIILGLFNLIPAFPLDGGRILRSALWSATKDLRRATRSAARVSHVFAWLFIVTGVAMIFGARVPVFGTGLLSGLWIVLIGWFLNGAAAASYRQQMIEDLLEDVPVARLMRSDLRTLPPRTTVAELVYDAMLGTDQHAFPVVEGGRLEGLVCPEDVRKVPRDRWETATVKEIMTPRERLAAVGLHDEAVAALRAMTQRDVSQVPVVEGERFAGLLRRRDIVRWLHLQDGAPGR